MTWKSYAAVSGATVLAGWLASSPPSNAPVATGAAPPPSPQSPARPAIDIEEQAVRLQSRMQIVREFSAPRRNPFRFDARLNAAAEPAGDAARPDIAAPVVDLAPPAPRVAFAGVAEEEVEGRTVRTAVLSAGGDVLLVREGDEVLGYYRVAVVEPDSIELVRLTDGATARIALGASR